MSSVRTLMRGVVCCVCTLPIAMSAAAQDAPSAGLHTGVVFDEISPLSASSEILRRTVSPLAAAAARRELARSRKSLSEQSIDPSKEIFTVYVPSAAPPRGYGLLVFVPPWRDARLPPEWAAVLDQAGTIFVSAANSGNDANVLGRRVPLALIAYQNVVDRYRIDPEHVYVGGFSGGSRVAMRLALGYPDIFRGALLDAGADPLGNTRATVPPRALFAQFQDRSRLVYVAGDQDTVNVAIEKDSIHSMRDWCVTDIDQQVAPHTSHETPDSIALTRAFAALYAAVLPDPVELATCRAQLDGELMAQLQQVDALIAADKRDEARKLLLEIDLRFGGLAAPKSVALDAELNTDAP